MKGIKLEQNKNISLEYNIKKTDTKYLYFNVPDNYDIKIKKNDKVKINTILAESLNDTSIISSVSGKVVQCDKVIKIQNDYKENIEKIDISNMTKEKFVQLLKDSGIKGMSGSGYKTYKKYDIPSIKTLVVNAIECEPYITSDYALIREHSKEIIEGIKKIMEINNIEKSIIVIKRNNHNIEQYFKEYLTSNITIYKTKNIYPAGWSKGLMKELFNLDYTEHATDNGIIVNNVATIYAIKRLLDGIRLESRVVTITGDTPNRGNYLLKIGTDIKDIMDTKNLIIGGPMMGLEYNNNYITSQIGCLLVLDNKQESESPCIRCGKCINVCPVNIEPVLIKDNINNKDKLQSLNPNRCIGCGLCSYICPARINLRDIVSKAKK